MIAQARFKTVHWMLLAVLVLAPTAVVAQQDSASEGQNRQDQDQRDLPLPVPANRQVGSGEQNGTAAIADDQRQMRGLDDQVQELKSDVLSIAEELSRLEERLLYPSGTQVAIFVALAEGDAMRLDAVRLQIDGQLVAHYIYSATELEALRKGGVQRIYVGNVATGDHQLDVLVDGQLPGGEDFSRAEHFTFRKDVEPKLVELRLAGPGSGNAPIALGEL